VIVSRHVNTKCRQLLERARIRGLLVAADTTRRRLLNAAAVQVFVLYQLFSVLVDGTVRLGNGFVRKRLLQPCLSLSLVGRAHRPHCCNCLVHKASFRRATWRQPQSGTDQTQQVIRVPHSSRCVGVVCPFVIVFVVSVGVVSRRRECMAGTLACRAPCCACFSMRCARTTMK